MNEYDLREKYRKLKSNLFKISNELIELNSTFNILNDSIKNNIDIDGKNPIEDSMNLIYKTINSINSDIKNQIIPMINNKL